MSRFTNDVDTLREAISQGAPQLISSFISIVGTFVMMLFLNPLLTLLILVMLAVMLWVVKTVGGKSALFFKAQQQAVGAANGYIEEMIEGQNVVKVFCHEEAVKGQFAELNENLRKAATSANTYASIIMPIMGNLSYVNYALTAAAGAVMVIRGMTDIGSIASFLQYTRSFSQPIVQVSQQFNSILSALAGAERIFEIIDTPVEIDEGYVQLVNCTHAPDGTITESAGYTGMWAWKHPHHDGSVTYTRLMGDVQFENVHFGYEEGKTVLKGISLYAKPGQKIAFVGSTGAGKTTITNLLNRFTNQRRQGALRRINIRRLKRTICAARWPCVAGYPPVHRHVRDKFRYGKLDANDDEIIAAATLQSPLLIKHLPQATTP
jgi:ATP-binding cassette subfamily B protein